MIVFKRSRREKEEMPSISGTDSDARAEVID
jgi:hypothetical protein